MKRYSYIHINAAFLGALLLLAGCADNRPPGESARGDMRLISSSLKKASKTNLYQKKIQHLIQAYTLASTLEQNWPDEEKVPKFLHKRKAKIDRIPGQVYTLSIESRDIESFKWSVAHGALTTPSYEEYLAFWKMGKYWRDYFIEQFPDQALPIFMNQALDERNRSFFDQYIERFASEGYPLVFPLERTPFFSRLCRFLADELQTALEKRDTDRIADLLSLMPPYDPKIHVDPVVLTTMRELSDALFHDLKDEPLACEIIELGYELERVRLDETGFGEPFSRLLMDHPAYTVQEILYLDQWNGPLTALEYRFITLAPDSTLPLIHRQHLRDAVKVALKEKESKQAMRLLAALEATGPVTAFEYNTFLDMALEDRDLIFGRYVQKKAPPIDPFRISLAELGKTPNLFLHHAPKIFKKIKPTMDRTPQKSGTTIGRIDDMLTTHCPEAALYVVKKYDLEPAWNEATTEGRTLLMAVCEGGNFEAAKYLIEKRGANVRDETAFTPHGATLFGTSRAKEGKLNALFYAAKSGNTRLISYLNEQGLSVNAQSGLGSTPLMYAVSANRPAAVKLLIEKGADVHATMSLNLNPGDLREEGGSANLRTAYRRAMMLGNREILDLLIEAGARP